MYLVYTISIIVWVEFLAKMVKFTTFFNEKENLLRKEKIAFAMWLIQRQNCEMVKQKFTHWIIIPIYSDNSKINFCHYVWNSEAWCYHISERNILVILERWILETQGKSKGQCHQRSFAPRGEENIIQHSLLVERGKKWWRPTFYRSVEKEIKTKDPD